MNHSCNGENGANDLVARFAERYGFREDEDMKACHPWMECVIFRKTASKRCGC